MIEQKDSDLGSNGISDVFDLSTFTEATFDEIGMGFILPRDVEVKVWDDAYEPGVEGASLRLVTVMRKNGGENENLCELTSKPATVWPHTWSPAL